MSAQTGESTTGVEPFYKNHLWRLGSEGLWIVLLVVILLLVRAIGVSSSEVFLTDRNIQNMSLQLVILGFMVFPAVLILAAGGLDLSVGAVAALVGVVMAQSLAAGTDVETAFRLGMSAALLIGLINGVLVGVFRLPGALVTLGMMSVARGLAVLLTEGYPVQVEPGTLNLLSDLPQSSGMWALLVTLGLVIFLLVELTPFGRRPRPGAEREGWAARSFFVGLPYVLSSLAAGLVGVLLLIRLRVAQPTIATGYEVDVILAAVLGGTAVGGGFGNVIGAVLGVIFVVTAKNVANLTGLSSFSLMLGEGVVLLIVVALCHLYHAVVGWLFSRFRPAPAAQTEL